MGELSWQIKFAIVTDSIMLLLCVFLYLWMGWKTHPELAKMSFKQVTAHLTTTTRHGIDTAPPMSMHLQFTRTAHACRTGDVLLGIKRCIYRGALTWKDYGWLDLFDDIKTDLPLLCYVMTWYKILHSFLYVYIDEDEPEGEAIRSTIIPLDLNLVLAFILGSAVVHTLNKYLTMRNSIRTSLESICGCLQNIAMIVATLDLSEEKMFRRYCQLNSIHFLSFTACSRDDRYQDISSLYTCNLLSAKEYNLIKRAHITKKNLCMLQGFYQDVLEDMKEKGNEQDRRVFVEHVSTLRGKMGGGGLKLATQLYPPPAHECMNRVCAYAFLGLLPLMCWKENNGHISNLIGLTLLTLYVNLVLKLENNNDLLDYDPQDPAKLDTYAFNPDTYLLNTEVALWTIFYGHHERQRKVLGSSASFAAMEKALNVDERQSDSEEEADDIVKQQQEITHDEIAEKQRKIMDEKIEEEKRQILEENEKTKTMRRGFTEVINDFMEKEIQSPSKLSTDTETVTGGGHEEENDVIGLGPTECVPLQT